MKKRYIAAALLAGVVAVGAVAAANGGGDAPRVVTAPEAPLATPATVTAVGQTDELGDVVISGEPSLMPYLDDIWQVPLAITNRSSKTSDYHVTVGAASPDGATKYEDCFGGTQRLEPGQTQQVMATCFKAMPAGAAFKVADVIRNATTP